MTGQQLWEAARDGDAAKVHTLLSTQGAQSFINYQGRNGGNAVFGIASCSPSRGAPRVIASFTAGAMHRIFSMNLGSVTLFV